MTEKQMKILEMTKDICRVKHNCNDPCNPISACDALKYAERAVEAGYVKVVRCKECVNYCGFEHCKNGICDKDVVSKRVVYPTDFCSYGERKGGAE